MSDENKNQYLDQGDRYEILSKIEELEKKLSSPFYLDLVDFEKKYGEVPNKIEKLEDDVLRNYNTIQNNAQVLIAEDRDRLEGLEKKHENIKSSNNGRIDNLYDIIDSHNLRIANNNKQISELKEVLREHLKSHKFVVDYSKTCEEDWIKIPKINAYLEEQIKKLDGEKEGCTNKTTGRFDSVNVGVCDDYSKPSEPIDLSLPIPASEYWKTKGYALVPKESFSRLFQILDYEGLWDSLDPEDYKWLNKFRKEVLKDE